MNVSAYRLEQTVRGIISLLLLVPLFLIIQLVFMPLVALANILIENISEDR